MTHSSTRYQHVLQVKNTHNKYTHGHNGTHNASRNILYKKKILSFSNQLTYKKEFYPVLSKHCISSYDQLLALQSLLPCQDCWKRKIGLNFSSQQRVLLLSIKKLGEDFSKCWQPLVVNFLRLCTELVEVMTHCIKFCKIWCIILRNSDYSARPL